MNLFKKRLGRGESATVGGRTPDDPLSDRAGQPAMITVFDGYGREMKITRKDWVVSVLRPGLRQARKDPEELSGLIIGALRDGFFSEVEDATVQLHGIDPNPARGAVLLAIVYLQTDRPTLAAKLLADHIARHGEDGIVLTNLAKAQDALGRGQESVETLWRALELDPNQDNGLEWYTTIHRQSDGNEGWLRALYRIAALPRSWRARLWLARHALEHGRLEDALSHYATSLEQAGEPAPPDLLNRIGIDGPRDSRCRHPVRIKAPGRGGEQQRQVGRACNLDVLAVDRCHRLPRRCRAVDVRCIEKSGVQLDARQAPQSLRHRALREDFRVVGQRFSQHRSCRFLA